VTEPATEEKVDPTEMVDIQFTHDNAPDGEKPATATVRRWQFEKVWEPKGWTVVEGKSDDTAAADTATAKAAGKHADTSTTTTPSK
jgi:hypothetical protein